MKEWIQNKKIVLAGLAALLVLGWQIATIYDWGKLRAQYFSTTVKLPVPYCHQEHSLSCEIASLRMALNYQGANVSEQELIQLLPFDTTPRDGEIWGNPNKGFVGKIDGLPGLDGYGVYWEPIAQLGQHWRKTRIIENGTIQDLSTNLKAKRPIVIWGYANTGTKMTWNTPAGEKVSAIHGEHARVVTGFAGEQQNPEGFFIADPIFGEYFWTRAELEKNWQSLGNHGVVVYAEGLNQQH